MPRKRPKSLETEVYRKFRELEHWAYVNGVRWKKTFKYDLIKEFREHITLAKDAYIKGYEKLGRYSVEKAKCFRGAYEELAIVESNMDHMIAPDICVMSDKEWAQAASMIDDIRIALTRFTNSLNAKGIGGSDCPDCGMGRETADYKDA